MLLLIRFAKMNVLPVVYRVNFNIFPSQFKKPVPSCVRNDNIESSALVSFCGKIIYKTVTKLFTNLKFIVNSNLCRLY